MSVHKDYVWNTIAGIINAAEAVVMAMVTMRLGTIEEAGVLTVSFAVGNLLLTVGKFGARVFHSTDIKKIFPYGVYLKERWITVFAMALLMAVYVGLKTFDGVWSKGKALAVVFICCIYMVEALEDCVWGELQRAGFLYVGGRMFAARWAGILLSFIAIMAWKSDFVLSLGGSFVVSVFVFLFCIFLVHRNPRMLSAGVSVRDKADAEEVFSLFRQTVPFFLSSFCVLYLNNAPKFAIDSLLSDADQACFGFIAMPVFVIALLNQFVYQPYLVVLSEEWNGRKLNLFRRRICRQIAILAGISAACVIGAAWIGIPVLSWIYNTDLSGYWNELLVLQAAGFFLALSGYFTVILTTMREGKKLLTGYIMTMVISFVMMGKITERYGTIGAAVGYMVLMMILCLYYVGAYFSIVKAGDSKNGQME